MVGYGIAFLSQMPLDQMPDAITIYRSMIGLAIGFLLSLRVAMKDLKIEPALKSIQNADQQNVYNNRSDEKKDRKPPMLGVFI